MRTGTKYPGVSLISSNPEGYVVQTDGSVEIPHGRPVEGQRLEDSNYYDITEGKDMNDIMRKAGLPTGEVIMGPRATNKAVSTGAKKRGRKSSNKNQATEPVEIPKFHVEWDIPGIGSIKSEYSGVYVGFACVAIHVSEGDNAFIPKDYRENNQALYIMKYKGYEYKVIYSGLNYIMGKCTVYVLIGGYNDGQEK